MLLVSGLTGECVGAAMGCLMEVGCSVGDAACTTCCVIALTTRCTLASFSELFRFTFKVKKKAPDFTAEVKVP